VLEGYGGFRALISPRPLFYVRHFFAILHTKEIALVQVKSEKPWKRKV